MKLNIIEQHEIKLSESHSKMVISGWGKEAFEKFCSGKNHLSVRRFES